MDKIKAQAQIVSQLLLSGETSEIYARTLTRTWDILREIGVLLWLVICLTFVGGEWFYRTAVGLGRSTRAWYTGLGEKGAAAESQPMAATGEALLGTLQSGTAYLLSQARQQLGIPNPEPTTPAASPPSVPAPAAIAPDSVFSPAESAATEDDEDDDLA